jgi:superfamily II DNA or RNA helicase
MNQESKAQQKMNKLYITQSGIFIPFDYLQNNENVNMLEKYFTLKYRTIVGTFKTAKAVICDRQKQRIIIPRYGLIALRTSKKLSNISKILDSIPIVSQIAYEPPTENLLQTQFKFVCELSAQQKMVIDTIKNNYFTEEKRRNGQAGIIIDMPPGLGKTHTSAYFTSLYGKTAIILHSSATLGQWKSVYKSCFPNLTDADFGEYHSTKKKLGDIMFIIIKSAVKSDFTFGKKDDTVTYKALDFYRKFNLVIFDECHKYANRESRTVFDSAQTAYMIGLSGTPTGRLDGFDPIIQWNIGPILNYASLVNNESDIGDIGDTINIDVTDDITEQKTDSKLVMNTEVEFKAIVHKIKYYGPPSHTRLLMNEKLGMYSTSETITMICDDKYRIAAVMKCIDDALAKNLYLFVFADRREYLSEIMETYNEKLKLRKAACSVVDNSIIKDTSIITDTTTDPTVEIVTNDQEFYRVVGGSSEADMQLASSLARVIFTTYQYMDTGKSIPRMTGIILATPRKSNTEQTVGRILRINSDASITRHIYDVVDMGVKLNSQWSSRKKFYTKKNFEIEETTYNHNELGL